MRVSSPTSFGIASKSLSRRPSCNKKTIFSQVFFALSFKPYNLQILQVLNFWWEKFKVIIAQIKCSQGLHHEEISRQCVFTQIIVRQVKHFQHRERSKTSWQCIQTVDRTIEDPQFGHRRQRQREFLQMIVRAIQNFEIYQIGNARRQHGELVVTQGNASEERHVH